MPTQLQLRRGTTTEHSTFSGAVGEVTVDTTKDTLIVHDGATNGGFPLAKEAGATFGNTNVTGNFSFADNAKAQFGAGSDLQIYHDSADSYVTDVGTGSLYLGADSTIALTDAAVTQNKAQFITGGAVNLFYNNALKFATTNTGVDITGGLNTTGNVGIGGTPTANGAGYTTFGVNGSTAGIIEHQANGVRQAQTYATTSAFTTGSITAIPMTFGTNNSERMRIEGSSGNLLVGTTSALITGTAKLSVNGPIEAVTSSTPVIDVARSDGVGPIINLRQGGGAVVGSIGVAFGDLYIGTGDQGLRFSDGADYICGFNTSTGEDTNGTTTLGYSLKPFKDLYLSGGVYLGGIGSANKLEDYEEGTWNPVLKASSTNPTYTTNNTVGHYVKIGNMVYVTWYSSVLDITYSGSGGAQIGNLPFTAASGTQEYWLFNYQHGTGISGTNTSGGYVERNNNNLIFIQQGTVLNSTWAQLNGRYVMVSAAYRTA